MKQELKQAWTAELRDPNAKQARGYLKTDKGRCCLGVLAEVCHVPNKLSEHKGFGESVDTRMPTYEFDFRTAGEDHNNERMGLPRGFLKRVGLDEDDACTLAEKNDHGHSFAEIADWIDEHVEVD